MTEDLEIENTGSPMENQDIMTMIDFTTNGNYSKATEIFNDMLMHRVDDALEQKKIAMADKVFNGFEDEEQLELDLDYDEDLDDEELDLDDDLDYDEDLTDEEIEDAVDEMETEED